MTVFGPSVVVLSPGTEDLLEEETAAGWWPVVRAPVSSVIDAIDTLMDADSGAYKRLPAGVDTGFIHVSDTYTGESVRRVRADGVLVDKEPSLPELFPVQLHANTHGVMPPPAVVHLPSRPSLDPSPCSGFVMH